MNNAIAVFLIFICHHAWAFNPDFCKDNAPEGIKRTVTDILKWSTYQNGHQGSCEELVEDPTRIEYVNIAENPFDDEDLSNYDLSPLLELPDLWKIYIADSDVLTQKNKDAISKLNQLIDFRVHVKFNKSGYELQDLSFLTPHSKSLTSLSLINFNSIKGISGPIKDVEALKTFTKLIELNLTGMDLKSLRPLMSMGNLLYLTLDGNNNLENLDGIQHLINLDSFSFRCEMECDIGTRNNCRSCNRKNFVDFSYLKNLFFLRELIVPNNKIKDIHFLSHLKNLINIDLSYNEITDEQALISSIENMNELESLNLSHNNLILFSPKREIPSIKELALNNNGISEFDLKKFPSLNSLSLSFNNLHKIGQPNKLIKLKNLELRNNKLSSIDLSSFDLSEVKTIDLTSNFLTEISINEENLYDGVTINLGSNNFTKIPAFPNTTKISEINLSNNQIAGQIDISELKNIKILDLTMNKIEGFFSTELMELTSLECSYNKLSDLNLENFQNLGFLDASHNKINKISLNSTFRILDLSFNQLGDINDISASAYSKINLAHNLFKKVPSFNTDRLGKLDLSFNPNLKEVSLDQFAGITELNLSNKNMNIIALPSFVKTLEVGKIDVNILIPSLLSHLDSIIFDFNALVLSSLKNNSQLSVIGINNLDKLESLYSLDVRVLALNNPDFILAPEELSRILPNLDVLALKKTKLLNLDFKSFTNLSGLVINESGIDSIPELGQNIESLTHLDLSQNNIIQIDRLKKYQNLKALNLSYNPIIDLMPLSGLSLKTLNLNGTLVDNLWPISHMNLSPLSFVNTPVYKNPSSANCPLSSNGNVDNYCRVLIKN